MEQTTSKLLAPSHEWASLESVWHDFVSANPVLDMRPDPWALTNFLRSTREKLVDADAIRKAKGRFWIAHVERFPAVAFALITGK